MKQDYKRPLYRQHPRHQQLTSILGAVLVVLVIYAVVFGAYYAGPWVRAFLADSGM